jgi:hypothetical protein
VIPIALIERQPANHPVDIGLGEGIARQPLRPDACHVQRLNIDDLLNGSAVRLEIGRAVVPVCAHGERSRAVEFSSHTSEFSSAALGATDPARKRMRIPGEHADGGPGFQFSARAW